jgi:hypothetical protein
MKKVEKVYTKEDMKKCWNAACAYTVGSHVDFKQTHPNFKEWIVGELMLVLVSNVN